MTITNVNVRKLYENEKLKAIVSVTFDNMFVVHDIKVIEGNGKIFIAMPSKKNSDGRFSDIAHPINAEMRRMLETEILNAYYEAKHESEEDSFSN